MKKALGIIFVTFTLFSSTLAQQRLPPMSLDDIKNGIRELKTPDEKLRKYLDDSFRYLRGAPDSIFVVAKEIRNLEGLEKEKREAFSLYLTAHAWTYLNPDSAIFYAGEASEILKGIGEHDSYVSMENMKAVQLTRSRRYIQAESSYLEVVSYIESLPDQEEVKYPVHQIYGNLGKLYSMVGVHDLAIEMFGKFLEIEDNPASRCNILMQFSTSFMEMEEYKKAAELLSPCIEYESLPPPIMASVRANLSQIYSKLGDAELSLSLMEEASEISTKNRIPNISIIHLVELGNMYIEKGLLSKADSVRSKLQGNIIRRISPGHQISKKLFFAELALAKGLAEEALKFSSEAEKLARPGDFDPRLRNLFETKAKAYEMLGKTDKALEQYKLQQAFDQQRYDIEKQRNMAMMNVRYQLQNKNEELASMSDKLETARFRNILIIVVITLTGLYVLYRYRVYYLLQEEKTRTRIARDLHDDLSGTLSSISFFSEAAQRVQANSGEANRFLGIIDKSASEAKEKINDIIWAIDPSKDDWSVFLKKCKRFTADALDSKGIEYEMQIADDFNVPLGLELRQNLWLIYKEIIHNLAKHSEATKAAVTFIERHKQIYLEITDNGIGFDKNQKNDRNGLPNIQHRAELIGADVDLITGPGEGTTWKLSFKI